jgi:hypothetical protein
MTYRVFDININKLFGVFPTEAEDMRLVSVLLRDDEGYADDLAVSCEADDGTFAPALSGAALIARAEAVMTEEERIEARRHEHSARV